MIGEWPSFEKELLTRLTVCYLWHLSIDILVISFFSSEDMILVLIVSVPDRF